MVDILPDVEGGAGRRVEATPVIMIGEDGAPSFGGSSGSKDETNSTAATLGSGAEFPGGWVTNGDPQVGFNMLADQDGTLYVEFSPDGGDTITLSKEYDIRANEARFDVLVKFPARSHRVRFVNNGTPQGSFVLLTVTGSGLFPFVISERDEPVYVPLLFSGITSTQYFGLVDLSDRDTFPHSEVGRIDLHATYFQVDRDTSGAGSVRLGVITRIDGTDADIAYVAGVTFEKSSDRRLNRDRDFRHPIKLGQSGGALTKALAVVVENDVNINTSGTVTGPNGITWTPAVGDLIVRCERTAGAYYGSVSIQYAANVSQS